MLKDYKKSQDALKIENKETNTAEVDAGFAKRDGAFKELMMLLKEIDSNATTFVIKILSNATNDVYPQRKDLRQVDFDGRIAKLVDPDVKLNNYNDNSGIKNSGYKFIANGYVCKWCGQTFLLLAQLLDHAKCHDISENIETKLKGVEEADDDDDGVDNDDGDDDDVDNDNDDADDELVRSLETTKVLKRSRSIVGNREAYRCSECNVMFKRKENYTIHLRKHSGERPYECHQCGKQFSLRGSFSYHLKHVHMGIKDHGCKTCGRKFATKVMLVEHCRTHTNERPYICHFCGKTFKTKAALYIHNRTHTNEHPFVCNVCDMKFKFRSVLNGHLLIHTGERKHMCDICNKRFRLKNELTRHKGVHNAEKRFSCPVCVEGFAVKRYLRRHMKSRHNYEYSNGN